MKSTRNRKNVALVPLLLLIALPATGVVLAGKPIGRYLEFPPMTRYVEHAGFSWAAFIGLVLAIAAVTAPFVIRVLTAQDRVARTRRTGSFPWWGWGGLTLTGLAWLLAWTRFGWFAPLQTFTFSPIWFGYIVTVNALTQKRTGHCMLRDRPRYFAALFVVSAGFWWYFEYLNRFVQNWYYVGTGDLSRLEYFVFATLPFSTVLPAVLGTRDLLASFPRLHAGLDDWVTVRTPRPRIVGLLLLIVCCASLAGIGLWPDLLFPLLWISPLCIVTAWQAFRGRRTIFHPLREGNWRNIYLLALSALVCGFFWELWNNFSAAKWIYTVPFVHRFEIFEMPVLGFAGYLPFGLECAVVAHWFLPRSADDGAADADDSKAILAGE